MDNWLKIDRIDAEIYKQRVSTLESNRKIQAFSGFYAHGEVELA